MRLVQVLLRDEISEDEDIYRRKQEWKLQQNSMRRVRAEARSECVVHQIYTAGKTPPPTALPVVSLQSTATPLPHLSLSLTTRFRDKREDSTQPGLLDQPASTIRPTLLGDLLTAMQVDAALVSWIVVTCCYRN